MDSGGFSGLQSQLASVSNYSHYNKSSTCRSYSYSSPSISPPCRHPVRYIMIFFFNEKGITFLTLRAYTYTITLKVFIFQSTITLAVSCASPSTTLKIFLFQSITTLAVFCASPPSIIPTVFLCRSFLSFHLLILTPDGLRMTPYRCF